MYLFHNHVKPGAKLCEVNRLLVSMNFLKCKSTLTVSTSHIIYSYNRLILRYNELERVWNETELVEFQILSYHLSAGTRENHEILRSGYNLLV